MASQGQRPTIVRTSPPPSTRPAPTQTHPRRPPANRSVSLRHPTSQKNSSSSSDPGVSSSNTDSPSSLRPLVGKGSSGESSNADKWFEQSNNAVRDNSTSFADNDPPFFMRNSSSSETPPERQQPPFGEMTREIRADSLPLRTGLLALGGTEGSTSEDFRSVIDDLTVQNKKLKRRLKQYEKLHDAHLKDDKLFEVRIHGLPPEKKRELEETLQKFASELNTTGANAFPSDGNAGLVPMLKHKTAASSVSMQNTDSAYASMSASGQGSTGMSGTDRKHQLTPTAHLASRQQNIHNYLHDIPQGLLPRQSPTTLSERAKKKLVVRRMEQIFAGKGAAPSGHQHSLQQEEVSQSAAQADRTEIELSGQSARLEGKREARIMQNESEGSLNKQSTASDRQAASSLAPASQAVSTSHSPARDQRPTRPLDLDPHRAQVPQDNFRYMEHLGFTPPTLSSSESPEDGHGWIYLNFLINMAQLHTINVTSDFVRKALGEFSDKFEVSDDGRKVRWRGRHSLTRTSSNAGGSSNDRTSEDASEGLSPRKRVKLSHPGSAHLSQTTLSGRKPDVNKHAYTPLFFHRDSSDGTDDSSSEAEEEDDSSSLWPSRPAAGDSSGMTSSGIRTSTAVTNGPNKKKAKQDNGPIIFYNNARFCTDLSGDRKAVVNKNAPAYTPACAVPIGSIRKGSDQWSESRGPLAQAAVLPEPMDIGDNPIPQSMELCFPQRSPIESSSGEETDPIDLEVTGIGGVWPVDNFAIQVKSRYARVAEEKAPPLEVDAVSKTLPRRFANILHGDESKGKARSIIQERVVASKFKELPPSELPEALSFMPFGDDSTGDDDESEVDDAMSDAPESTGDAPSAALQPVDLPYNSDSEEESESDDEQESDSEVDFLAAARVLNPEAVRQREREYDANMAERLAEEIPAGSSAATAGGGSGFASPANGMTQEEHQRATREARVQAANASRVQAKQAEKKHDKHDGDDDDSDAEMSDAGS